MEKEYDFSKMTVGDAQRLNVIQEQLVSNGCKCEHKERKVKGWFDRIDDYDKPLVVLMFVSAFLFFAMLFAIATFEFVGYQTCVKDGRTYIDGVCLEGVKASNVGE